MLIARKILSQEKLLLSRSLIAVVRRELWLECGYIVCCIFKIKDCIFISRLAILSLVVIGQEISATKLYQSICHA